MSTAVPPSEPVTPSSATLPPLEQLPDDPDTLKRMILELLATLHQERCDREQLRQRLELLLQRRYGPRTERFDPQQPLLFDNTDPETTAPAEAAPALPEPAPRRRRARPHGRRRLPDNLPRREVEHELTEAERVCSCGGLRIDIGVEVSEQLDWQPASLFIWRHRVHKYACPHCAGRAAAAPAAPAAEAATPTVEPATATTVVELASSAVVIAAKKPAMPLDKGLPGPGLLADLIVNKFVDHLPLYRQQHIYQRQGLFLPRSTTCDWLAACAELLRPLYQLMVSLVLQSRWLHTDDTTVKNRQPSSGATPTARLWGYLGDTLHPYNVFDFTPNRKRDGPQRFLAGFHGFLHADAFSGYDALYLPSSPEGEAAIQEVACNAHARRKFYEARGSDAVRAHRALAYYAQLYELERQARDWDEEQRWRLRQDLALPILEQFKAWLEQERSQVLPKSPMAEAIGYALNNWSALIRYTEAGFLSIDNNVAEREMKRIAIGRKNWLFVGSERGGHTAAVLLSFTSTCARLQVEPWAYLQDVLSRLPSTSSEHLVDLLPDRWQAARVGSSASAAAES